MAKTTNRLYKAGLVQSPWAEAKLDQSSAVISICYVTGPTFHEVVPSYHAQTGQVFLLSSDFARNRLYKVRMWIEEMYGDMKGHGFDLEATHLQGLERLSRLMLAICPLYMGLISLGSWVVKRGLRHLVDRKDRRDKSYSRIGWDWLERSLSQGLRLRLQSSPYVWKVMGS